MCSIRLGRLNDNTEDMLCTKRNNIFISIIILVKWNIVTDVHIFETEQFKNSVHHFY